MTIDAAKIVRDLQHEHTTWRKIEFNEETRGPDKEREPEAVGVGKSTSQGLINKADASLSVDEDDMARAIEIICQHFEDENTPKVTLYFVGAAEKGAVVGHQILIEFADELSATEQSSLIVELKQAFADHGIQPDRKEKLTQQVSASETSAAIVTEEKAETVEDALPPVFPRDDLPGVMGEQPPELPPRPQTPAPSTVPPGFSQQLDSSGQDPVSNGPAVTQSPSVSVFSSMAAKPAQEPTEQLPQVPSKPAPNPLSRRHQRQAIQPPNPMASASSIGKKETTVATPEFREQLASTLHHSPSSEGETCPNTMIPVFSSAPRIITPEKNLLHPRNLRRYKELANSKHWNHQMVNNEGGEDYFAIEVPTSTTAKEIRVYDDRIKASQGAYHEAAAIAQQVESCIGGQLYSATNNLEEVTNMAKAMLEKGMFFTVAANPGVTEQISLQKVVDKLQTESPIHFELLRGMMDKIPGEFSAQFISAAPDLARPPSQGLSM